MTQFFLLSSKTHWQAALPPDYVYNFYWQRRYRVCIRPRQQAGPVTHWLAALPPDFFDFFVAYS